MAFGLIQGLLNIKRQKKANEALTQLQGQDPEAQASPYAGQQLATAQNYLNGLPDWAKEEQQGILSSGANFNSAVDRSADSGSQALATKAAGLGQTNQNLSNLGVEVKKNKYSMLQNLNDAYAGMINEGRYVFGDKVRRFGDKAQIQGQIQQNKTNALNGVFNGLNSDINQGIDAFGAITGMGGGFGKLFGGGKQQGNGPYNG